MDRADFKGGIDALHFGDSDAFAGLKATYHELVRRAPTTQTFTEFLVEELLLKAVYSMMSRVKGDGREMAETIAELVGVFQPFFDLTATPHRRHRLP